jgi:hypothetical protein
LRYRMNIFVLTQPAATAIRNQLGRCAPANRVAAISGT